ncbi:hypothetical protein KC721_01740 [Candidatus Woesebacteria bacterium]|nr:hypothetical protein [Candidatus Woesebacteria bacterium]
MLLRSRSFLLAKENFTSFFSRKKQPESRFDQWDATAYIKMAALSEYRSYNALTTLLTANFVSFAAEYTRGEVVSEFEMDVDPHTGLLGMLSSYTTGMLGMGENFEDKLSTQRKSPTRAQIETNNMYKLDQWSVAAPVGSVFIWNSPPGLVNEGYAGLNSHSFIFVYEKTSQTKVILHQYRTWMSLEQHQQFQNFATQKESPTNQSQKSDHEIINNTCIITPQDHGVQSAAELVSVLEKKAYESEDSWKVKPKEMPQINDKEYGVFRDFLLSLYIREVVPLLLTEVPEVSSDQDPRWKSFVTSREYSKLVTQLDLAFGLLAYQPLVKWVEASDTSASESKSVWKQLFGQKNDGPSINSISHTQVEEGLMTMYSLQLAKLHGETIQKGQAQNYNSLASMLLSTTSKGLSLGQCGIGTFIPTRLISNSLSVQLGPTIPAVPGMAGGTGSKEKSEALNHLNSLAYFPLTLSNDQTWYIKAEHFATYQEFFETNPLTLSEDGIPIGPCGWALRGDPRGNDNLVLSAPEYNQFQLLRAQLLHDLLDNPEAGFESFAEELLSLADSEQQKKELSSVVELLRQALKTSVGIGDMLFNDYFDRFMMLADPLLSKLSKKMDLSEFVLRPTETAENIVTLFSRDSELATLAR